MSSQPGLQEADRWQVANRLKTYLQTKSKLDQTEIQKYTDKIRSGIHDDFLRQISVALEEEARELAQDLFADADSNPSMGRARYTEIMTFLLMQDEDDRLSSANSRIGRQRDKKDLKLVTAAFEKQVASEDTKQFISWTTEPYPPCIAPLDKLEKIKLCQLTEETHHRGRILLVKRLDPLNRRVILTDGVVVDEDGDAEMVELFHAGSDVELHIPPDMLFAIKEPYFYMRRSGTPAIRVDHPINIVYPKPLQGLLSEVPKPPMTKSASEWKELGNGFFTKKQFFDAGEAYRTALEAGAEGKLRLDLNRNLARVDLTLGRYEQAVKNAINAVSDGKDSALADLDGKAYYRAGCACYLLRDFEKAEEYFEKLLALSPNDSEGRRELVRVQQRLAEQQDGNYDFGSAIQKLSRQQPRVDIADFKRLTAIEKSEGRGLGLFAAEDIKLGDILVCEKAYCATMEWEDEANSIKAYDPRRKLFDGFPAALWTKSVQKLSSAPLHSTGMTNLCGHYADNNARENKASDTRALDAFQIHEILAQNTFALPTPSKSQRTQAFAVMKTFVRAGASIPEIPNNCGIYTHASFVNHSCVPNSTRVFIGDVIVIRATRPIAKGDEILHAYGSYADIREKQSRMSAIWNFQCDCQLCAAEIMETDDTRERRAKLLAEADKLGHEIIANLPNSYQWREGSRRAEKLLTELSETYDAKIYEGLPRSGLCLIQTALAHVYLLRSEYTKCKAVISDAFDALGWTLTLQKGAGATTDVLKPKPDFATRLSEDMVSLLAIAYRMLLATKKDKKLAKQVRELAETVYVTLNGVINGIEMIDQDLGKGVKTSKT